MSLLLRGVSEDDLDLLAEMNKQLIEDEGSSNPMNRQELKERMREWLRSSWNADLLVLGDEVVGYALYCYKRNQHDPNRREVYLRQYFIKREFRQRGYGLLGIERLRESRFKGIDTIEIEVLDGNSTGKSFWQKAGFLPYSILMKLENDSSLINPPDSRK
ncbi:GNAT family N-acetyltransferase [Cohnella sp. AR92]|uniref:GNAT family N-acetyltransferase n=1 Tax=Cohnella sp. AR92 TaxID=648716 RepID=UPI0013156724|nr:GNAT family N-acetyltransferase [Cohnella sp. AR92]